MSDTVQRAGIDANTADGLAERILANRIDLSIVGIERDRIVRAKDAVRTLMDGVERALSGEDRGIVARCLENVRARDQRISLELLAILAHVEVNAATWLAMSDDLDHIRIPRGRGANVMPPEARNIVDSCVHFGSSRYRMPDGIIDMPSGTIPATLAIAATGRPLAEVAAHPALDGFALTVSSISESDGCMQLIYDGKRPTIALSELHDGLMWPDPGAMTRIHALAAELREAEQQDTIDGMTTATA